MNAKKHFALKLIAPRPSFVQDMIEEERAVMQEHLQYWNGLLKKNIALVFGPVLDPAGPYGFGIIAVEDEMEAAKIAAEDPANGLHRFEYYPMLAVVR